MFQHLVEILPRRVEAVIAAKGRTDFILMPMILEWDVRRAGVYIPLWCMYMNRVCKTCKIGLSTLFPSQHIDIRLPDSLPIFELLVLVKDEFPQLCVGVGDCAAEGGKPPSNQQLKFDIIELNGTPNSSPGSTEMSDIRIWTVWHCVEKLYNLNSLSLFLSFSLSLYMCMCVCVYREYAGPDSDRSRTGSQAGNTAGQRHGSHCTGEWVYWNILHPT